MGLKFLRADENILYGGTVTTTAGTTDSTYNDDWLVDGRGRPAKATSGTVTWSAVGSSGQIGVVVLHSHNIDAARTITIAGGVVSATGSGPAARTNGIPVNPWIAINTPASGTTVSVGIASNSAAVTIGELLAGKLRETSRGLANGSTEIGYVADIGAVRRRNPSGSVPDYDRGLVARTLKSVVRCTNADRLLLEDWYESTRNDTRPSAMLPFADVNDAWVVSWASPPQTLARVYESSTGITIFEVAVEFQEWARKRW